MKLNEEMIKQFTVLLKAEIDRYKMWIQNGDYSSADEKKEMYDDLSRLTIMMVELEAKQNNILTLVK